jgi:hypothetical protein
MTTKQRSPGKIAISVSMSEELLLKLDARATALGLNRSQYLAQLARADLASGGDLTLRETPPPHGSSSSPVSAPVDSPDKMKLVVFPPGVAAPESAPKPPATRPEVPVVRRTKAHKIRTKSPSPNPVSQSKKKA